MNFLNRNLNIEKDLKIDNLFKRENLYLGRTNCRKKGGFTLIEVIAVIAIIGIMASVLLPKFTKYINEAKKLKVVEQSRKVVMAVEAYNMKADHQIPKTASISTAKGNSGVSKYFEDITNETDKLVETMTVQDCYNIVNGDEFSINTETGVFTNLGVIPKGSEEKAQ